MTGTTTQTYQVVGTTKEDVSITRITMGCTDTGYDGTNPYNLSTAVGSKKTLNDRSADPFHITVEVLSPTQVKVTEKNDTWGTGALGSAWTKITLSNGKTIQVSIHGLTADISGLVSTDTNIYIAKKKQNQTVTVNITDYANTINSYDWR